MIIVSSVALALLGVFVSRLIVRRLAAGDAQPDAHACWAIGLFALLPAWLVPFIGLLGTQPGAKPQAVAGAVWVVSAAAALIGVIVSEARVRGAGRCAGAHDARRLWRLGLLALLPAWVIVLGGHVAR